MSIFNKIGSKETPTQKKLESIRNTLSRQVVNKAIVEKAISMESYTGNDQQFEDEVRGVQDIGKMAYVEAIGSNLDSHAKKTIAQEDAAIYGLMKATAPLASSKVVTHSMLLSKASDTTIVMGQRQPSLDYSIVAENYDKPRTRIDQAATMLWNIEASKQSELGETFFPTYTLAPDQFAFSYEVKLIQLVSNNLKDFSQKPSNWKRKNLLGAERDHTMLENTITELVPVYTTQSTALSQFSNGNVTDTYFSSEVPTTIIQVNGVDVPTRPLAPNKEFNLLEISQTEASLKNGIMDNSDSIDSSIRLKNIYIKLGNGDIVKYYVKNTPSAAFNPSSQGIKSVYTLRFSDNSMLMNTNTKRIDGADLTMSLSNYNVRFSVTVFGECNTEEGLTSFTPTGYIKVNKITDDEGRPISLTTGIGKTIADNFYNETTNTPVATIIGIDPFARTTNTNHRQRGPLLTMQAIQYLYDVPRLSPFGIISAPNSNGSDSSDEASQLDSLIAATRFKMNNDAVTALFNAAQAIKEKATHISDLSLNYTSNVFGPVDTLVTPAYIDDILPVGDSLNSLTSTSRGTDVAMTIVNKLRTMVYDLIYKSNYEVALKVMGINDAPIVLIATDPVLAQYLNILGDTRLLGDKYDFKIVTTQDARMKDKIMFSFGLKDALSSGTPQPLHFGTTAWVPEIVANLQVTRNGAVNNELSVQPQYIHIPSLPIMGVLDVEGIREASTERTVISNSPVIPTP